MKRLLITFLIITMLGFVSVDAYELSSKDSIIVEKITKILDRKIQRKGESYKDSILELLKKVNKKVEKNTRKYEIIDALVENLEDIKVITQADIDNAAIEKYHANPSKMREHWLKLYNDYRRANGIDEFLYDKRLESTGQQWSDTMLLRGKISHERSPGDGYYNYPIIEQWFQNRGVSCKVSGRTTSTENTGYHGFYCPKEGDCTEKANEALKGIFDFYLAEKGLPFSQSSHYRTTTSPYLQYMGLGISFKDESNGWIQIYTAAHFCTEFE